MMIDDIIIQSKFFNKVISVYFYMEKQSTELIQRLINQEDPQSGKPFLKKYTAAYLTSILDRNKIQSIEKIYQSKEDGFNLLEFIRFFLNVLEHDEIQTLYITVALIDLFREISQSFGNKQRLFFVDITNYICNKILEKRNEENQIESKYITDYRTVQPNFKTKGYLIEPPKIYGSKDEVVYKLSANKIKVDKAKHQSVVTNAYFSYSLGKVFTLDALSDSISVYNTSCSLIKRIRPSFSKLKKDIVVLAFAYSERQERIGAVLKDFSVNFWDNSDNFQFEKSISTAVHCQEYQTNIWFFEYFNMWATSDKTGVLYLWDLELEAPQRKIKLIYETKINDLCVIPCINLLAIVQERNADSLNLNLAHGQKRHGATTQQPFTNKNRQKTNTENTDEEEKKFYGFEQTPPSANANNSDSGAIVLYDFFKGEAVAKIKLSAESRIPHTLQYSEHYQMLLSAGYEKKISIYEINKVYLDSTYKGELTGHQSLITSFTVLKKSPMVISADDKGKVKIWDIRNYKCVQTLDFKDKTNITRLLDMLELGKIGVLGSRINFVEFDEKNEIQKRLLNNKDRLVPLGVECDYGQEQLIVLTRKDLRIYDMHRGALKNIYCEFHNEQIQITFFKYFEGLKKFIIGTEKGEIKLYCIRTGALETRLIGHAGSIIHVEFDQQNRIFISMGQDNSIQIQKQIQNQGNKTPAVVDVACELASSPAAIKQAYKTTKIPKKTNENASNLLGTQSKSLTKHKNKDKKAATSKEQPIQQQQPNAKKTAAYQRIKSFRHSDMSLQSNQGMMLRLIKNNFYGNDIALAAVSIYHGFIAVASASPCCSTNDNNLTKSIYIWDYEYCKLLLEIHLPNEAEPTSLAFINGYSILVVGTSEGMVYLLKIAASSSLDNCNIVGLRSPPSNCSRMNKGNTAKKLTFISAGKSVPTHNSGQVNYQAALLAQYSYRHVGLEEQSLGRKQGDTIDKQSPASDEIGREYTSSNNNQDSKDKTNEGNPAATHLQIDLMIKGFNPQTEQLTSSHLHIAYNDGTVAIINLFPVLKFCTQEPSATHKQAFNAERQLRENFVTEIAKKKFSIFDIPTHRTASEFTIFMNCQELEDICNNKVQACSDENNEECGREDKQMSFITTPNNCFQEKSQFYSRKKLPDDDTSNGGKFIDGSSLVCSFQAHKTPITSLNVLELDDRYLITGAQDGRCKVWKNNPPTEHNASIGNNRWTLQCDLSINLPLPFQWALLVKDTQKYKNKIMFALKIIQEIFIRYGNDISINEAKVLKVRKLLDLAQDKCSALHEDHSELKLCSNFPADSIQSDSPDPKFKFSDINDHICDDRTQAKQQVTLFQNQFNKRDLHYDYVKKFNFSQIAGPTLRQIDVQKKLNQIQKEWKISTDKSQDDKDKLLISIRSKAQKNEEKEQILQFLEPKNFNKPPMGATTDIAGVYTNSAHNLATTGAIRTAATAAAGKRDKEGQYVTNLMSKLDSSLSTGKKNNTESIINRGGFGSATVGKFMPSSATSMAILTSTNGLAGMKLSNIREATQNNPQNERRQSTTQGSNRVQLIPPGATTKKVQVDPIPQTPQLKTNRSNLKSSMTAGFLQRGRSQNEDMDNLLANGGENEKEDIVSNNSGILNHLSKIKRAPSGQNNCFEISENNKNLFGKSKSCQKSLNEGKTFQKYFEYKQLKSNKPSNQPDNNTSQFFNEVIKSNQRQKTLENFAPSNLQRKGSAKFYEACTSTQRVPVNFYKTQSKNFRSILNKMNDRILQSKKKKIRDLKHNGFDSLDSEGRQIDQDKSGDKENLRYYVISTSDGKRMKRW